MIDPKAVIDMYSTTYGVIKLQTDGLTHEESLIQLPFGGNCLNWVVGHIVANRTHVERLLNIPVVWSPDDAQRYRRGSAPVTASEDAYLLETILEALDRSQKGILAALDGMTTDDMSQAKDDSTVGQQLAFLHFHEAYHSGQLEIFRQMAGKEPQIK